MPKEAGVILFLIVLGLIAYLLVTRHIGSAVFTVLFVVSVVALVLLIRIDDIKRIFVDVKAGQFAADLEQVRKDIYAKVEAVQRLGEIVAATSALQLSKLGRYGGAPNLERLQAERKRFAEMLRDLGTDPQRSDEILRPLDVIMTFDLAGGVTEAVRIEIANRRGPAKDGDAIAALNREIDEVQRLVRAALLEAPAAEAPGRAEQVLREKGLWTSATADAVVRFRKERPTVEPAAIQEYVRQEFRE